MNVEETPTALVNPKGHDEARIRGAIERFGFMDQPVLDERTGRLVAGHGRREQLIELKERGEAPPEGIEEREDGSWWWPVARGWSSRSDTEANAAGVMLNRLTEAGGWSDLDQLTEILADAEALDPALLDLTGYTLAELETLRALTGADPGGGGGDDDDDDDEAVLRRTDQAAWPRISCQVPPDVFDRWKDVGGNDDADRVMIVLRAWEDLNAAERHGEADEDEE